MNIYEKVSGVFSPRRTDDLQNDAHEYIGKTMEFRVSWLITDADSTDYAGEYALTPTDRTVPFGWVPSCDVRFNEAAA